MAARSHGPIRAGFELTFKSDARLGTPKHAALVALCRLLATQIDESGDGANNRLTAAYLSALKDVKAAMADRSPTAEGAGSGGALGKLQGLKGGKSA